MVNARGVKKLLLVTAAVIGAFVALKMVFALFSALIGVMLFLGVLALLSFGAYSVMRFVAKGRRARPLV